MSAIVDRTNGHSMRDAEIEEAARQAFARSSTLRIWSHALELDVLNGVVTCSGHVRTVPSKEMAEQLIRQVPGVIQVINRLFVDTDIEVEVAEALAHDPRTVNSFPGILVGCSFGDLMLKGNVTTQEIKKAAGEIAAKVPGVRGVTNELVAPEPPKPGVVAKAAPKPAAVAKAAPAADEESERAEE